MHVNSCMYKLVFVTNHVLIFGFHLSLFSGKWLEHVIITLSAVNTGFYPWNKSDIFTGSYYHTLKISSVIFTVSPSDVLFTYLKDTCSKSKENVILVLHTLEISNILSHSWNKVHIICQPIEYPLNIFRKGVIRLFYFA